MKKPITGNPLYVLKDSLFSSDFQRCNDMPFQKFLLCFNVLYLYLPLSKNKAISGSVEHSSSNVIKIVHQLDEYDDDAISFVLKSKQIKDLYKELGDIALAELISDDICHKLKIQSLPAKVVFKFFCIVIKAGFLQCNL